MKKKFEKQAHPMSMLLKCIIMVKVVWIIIMASVLQVSAGTNLSYSQSVKMNLHLENADLEQVIWTMKKQTEFTFFYSSEEVQVVKNLTINMTDVTAEMVLDHCLIGTSLTYEIVHKAVIIKSIEMNNSLIINGLPAKTTIEQKNELSGTVKDSKGLSLPGVTVYAKGSTIGTITDNEGKFRLSVPKDAKTIVFSFVGMKSQEISINNQTNFAIVLEEQPVGVEEVVVIGYGSQQKSTITGSISAIESSKLIQSPVANISNAIVGRVSGLLATQTSGAPGEDQSQLRIRGIGTFSGNASPLVMVDGIEAQTYNNIDPNEIDNISILKDASATAVYGVRGANGVVLITTKRGSIGKPQVSFSAQAAVTKFADIRQTLESPEFAEGYNEALKYDSYVSGVYTPQYSASDIQHFKDQDDPLFFPSTDWVKLMLKPYSIQSQYNLNISGGTERVKYFISGGYFEQGGLFKTEIYDAGFNADTKYKRYNFRSNFDFSITERLKARLDLSAQIEDLKGRRNDLSGGQNETLLAFMFGANPTISPGIWDGKIVEVNDGGLYPNPLLRLYGAPGYGSLNRQYNSYLNAKLRFDYSLDFILQGLSAHATFSTQNRNGVVNSFSSTLVSYKAIRAPGDSYQLLPQAVATPFSYGESTSNNRKDDAEFGFDYKRNFGNHFFSGLLLYNQSKEYPGPTLSIPRGYQGLVGRVTYDYKKRYLAEFNFGYNGTENFAVGKRFGYFPAYSLGWTVSEEPFFPKNDILPYMKLRGSYGEVGNDRIGGDRFLYNPSSYLYQSNQNYNFGVIGVNYNTYNGSVEGKIGNPLLTWERAKKLDIGMDLTILNGKIKIAVDYFKEKRDNILANLRTVPIIVGANLPAYNIGQMENGGWDGEITYNGKTGNLNYWAKGVITITHNKIKFMDEVNPLYPYEKQTGQRYGQNFGLVETGIYNTWEEVNDANRPFLSYDNNRVQPGDFKYKDINGDGVINSHDNVPIGYSAFPEQSFGLSFGADFKNLDLSVLFQGSSAYTHTASKQFKGGWSNGGNAMSYLLDRSWTQEKYLAGIATDFPHIGASGGSSANYLSNTFWQENAAYVRLKNIELGYTLTPLFLKRLGVGSVRLYVNGQNLFTWDKMFPGEDPEIPSYNDDNYQPYPIVKNFNCGLNIKF